MTPESSGQRIVREWREQIGRTALPRDDVALAACIDALVKQERAAVLREAAAFQQALVGEEWVCNPPCRHAAHDVAPECFAGWLRARAAEEEA